jgi:predicted alpha/beta superfamily hydrolase
VYLLDGELISEVVRGQVGYFCEIWRELPPITVVGIENKEGKGNRSRDLTPSHSQDDTAGGADNFLRFIKDELMPVVEKDYKEAPYRILVGSSLAGLFTVHTFLHHSDLFDAYVASSPALHVNNNLIMADLEQKIASTATWNKMLFFAVGDEGSRYIPNAMKLDSILKKMRLPYFQHRFVQYPSETHGTTPMKSYYDAFRFIFRVGVTSPDIRKEDLTYAALENYYKDRSHIFRIPMKPNEFIVNHYGYVCLFELKRTDRALEFFKKNIENYPQSANTYDSYAEALIWAGDKENALLNYERALELNPTSKSAQTQIAKLKKELKNQIK